jgi:hypothetical protein
MEGIRKNFLGRVKMERKGTNIQSGIEIVEVQN